ncbi:MAG: hypothetical protein VCA57_19790 [Pseudomonas sp.]|uniref:hypothetical protein n=1 Tax=Pseudomonas sp. TaxID=306 RepID=UPI0039825061
MSDVEIWFAQKTELYWFLRSNAEIERFLSGRKAALSETDFSTESVISCRSQRMGSDPIRLADLISAS